MSVIFTARIESNLSEFTAANDTEADISWSADAALAGSSGGMAVLVDNTTAMDYYKTFSPSNTAGKLRVRYYIDPNSIPMDNAEEIRHLIAWNSAVAVFGMIALIYNTSGGYKILGYIYNDAGGTSTTTAITITDAPHYVEFYIQRATNSTSNDGRLDVWVDGGSQQTVSGIDNYDRFNSLTYLGAGAFSFSGTPGTGTFYLDEIVANDDGSEIGPFSSGVTKTVTDTGAGVDTSSLAAALGLTDGGTSRDFLSLSATLSLLDSGVGSDLVSILQSLFKTITDAGVGLDAVGIQASLSVPDVGLGDQGTGVELILTLVDLGIGTDRVSISALLSLSDYGTGTDTISILTALFKTIQDNAYGIDGLNIAASLSLVELSSGGDGLNIQASLTVPDTGSGLDPITVSKIVSTLIQILDTASALDGISISASLNIPDTVLGVDSNAIAAQLVGYDVSISNDGLGISADLSITDTSSASDNLSILQAILKTVQDLASGTDFVGQISASLSLADSGMGADLIGQLLAALTVSDFGTGVEVVVKYDLTTRIVKISFIIGQKAITFAELKQYSITFNLASGG